MTVRTGKDLTNNLRKLLWPAALVVVLLLGIAGRRLTAQSDLNVTFGPNGLQQLSYKGQILEDLNTFPADAFHIWHMKSADLAGNTLYGGQYGWGEQNKSRSWNAATNTWTYQFSWGSIQVQYLQNGNNLDMHVTVTNAANSGIVFDGATIYPLVLHFPHLPANFYNSSYSQYAYNTTGPSITVADYSSGEVVSAVTDASKPVYSGFQSAGSNNAYVGIISSTTPDGLATFLPHNDRPVAPGQTDSFTVSLRFAPSGTPVVNVALDVYQSWVSAWPSQLAWADRRVIGTVYLASSPQGNVNQPAGFPNNPRRYYNDSNASDFDVTTASGLAKFQARILKQALNNVQNLLKLNAQGSITWDIEGEQYPQNTSYVCSPDQIGTAAPEMESVINDWNSPYAGLHLVDAYFKTMRDAGFRVGVCVRPQQFILKANGTASQSYLPASATAAQLIRKLKYAHDRWGATLFYIDSTVDVNGGTLDASIFQQAAAALPDSLLIPEETTPKHYAYTAAFMTFLDHGDLGTDTSIYNFYPNAFSANLVNDVSPDSLAAHQAALTASVQRGDILMAHADYWQTNNDTIVQIYKDAGVSPSPPRPVQSPTPIPPSPPTPVPVPAPVPTPAPTPNAVVITSPGTGSTISANVSVQAQVNVNLDPAGSYLMVDGNEIGTQRVTSPPYSYALNSTGLTDGPHMLQLWAHDTANNTWVSSPITVTVANSGTASAPSVVVIPVPVSPGTASLPIQIVYPVSGQALSGIVQVSATIAQQLDAAGSYLIVDGAEYETSRVGSAPFLYSFATSALAIGNHTLQVWAHDIANNTLLSNLVNVTVVAP